MRHLNELINERLKLNKNTKIKQRDLDNWTILTAERGDLVQRTGLELYFAYKQVKKYKHEPNDVIIYYWAIDLNGNHFYKGPDKGVGTLKRPELYKLASEEDKQRVYNGLKD